MAATGAIAALKKRRNEGERVSRRSHLRKRNLKGNKEKS